MKATAHQAEDFVDVNDLLNRYSIEQLLQSAEDYFAGSRDNEYFLKKPFASIDECGELLANFSQVLMGLRLAKGMKVLDFASGTCWSSRMLTQLGCDVMAMDASQTALEIGQKVYQASPPIGATTTPDFLRFDGHRFDIADESIDRIVCFDAFHHIPNQETVLKEMNRVLVPGGIAGFADVGPHHSKASQSQFEMRNYTVIERDTVAEEVDALARASGFSRVEFSVFSPSTFLLPLSSYTDFLKAKDCGFTGAVRQQLATRTYFFLHKPGQSIRDSRSAHGLAARISVELSTKNIAAGEAIEGKAIIRNVGSTVWLPSNSKYGPVRLGVILRDGDDRLIDLDYRRIALPGTASIAPGDKLELDFSFAAPGAGVYSLEFDMVSEGIAWFSAIGSPTCKTQNIKVG